MAEEAEAHHALASPTALASSAACNRTDNGAIGYRFFDMLQRLVFY
jgi:hypothetical protein